MKKIICILLASLMTLGFFTSCANSNTPDSETSDLSSESIDQAVTEETLDVPDTRYNGAELCFLVRGGNSGWSTSEIFSEGTASESSSINNAVYERNDRILNDYGVTILEIRKDEGSHNTAVQNEVAAPTGDFQAIISPLHIMTNLATNGFLWNLNSDACEYMDFTKSWWDSKMAEGLSVNGMLFMATGDLLTSDNDATFAIAFNKTLVTECKLPNMYDLVYDGEWTLDRFYEFEQTAVQDKNGDGKLTYDADVCGMAFTNDAVHSFFIGAGGTLCAKDENDQPYYALDVEKAQNISEIGKLIFAKEHTVDLQATMDSTGIETWRLGRQCFGEGHALFYPECMQTISHQRSYDTEFGILPYPKYDTMQKEYHSLMNTTASFVAIPRSIRENALEMICSMIEAMAYHAVDTLTYEYYEINLKTKTAKDEESGPMIDEILNSRVCELSYYYSWGSNAFSSVTVCLLPKTTKSISSASKRLQVSIEKSIREYIDKIEEIDE